MFRRTLFRRTAIGILGAPLCAQSTPFHPHNATWLALAATVLPASLGEPELARIASKFVDWLAAYHPGAEMEPGYGFPKLRYKPASPLPLYLKQLATLEAAGFPSLPLPRRRAIIESALRDAAIQSLPQSPDHRHLAADLMAFYFRSSEAYDRCFDASIRRDQCRGFDGFNDPPPPLPKGAK